MRWSRPASIATRPAACPDHQRPAPGDQECRPGAQSLGQLGDPQGRRTVRRSRPTPSTASIRAPITSRTQTTIYDASGNALTLTNYYVRDTAPHATATPPAAWKVYSFVGDQQPRCRRRATAPDADHAPLRCDRPYHLPRPPRLPCGFSAAPAPSAEQSITLDFGTQTSQTSQPFSVTSSRQDGRRGRPVRGRDDRRRRYRPRPASRTAILQPLGKVILANFTNPSGLRQLGNSTWAATGHFGRGASRRAATERLRLADVGRGRALERRHHRGAASG